MRRVTTLLLALAVPAWAQVPIDPDYQLFVEDHLAGWVFTPPGQDRCAYEELWVLFPGTPDVTVGDPFVGDPTGLRPTMRVVPVPQVHRDEADLRRQMARRHPGSRIVRVWNEERGGACPG